MTRAERAQMFASLDRCIEICGGIAPLAHKIEISRQAVDQWRDRGVPAERVISLERAVGGRVSRRELRPDLFEDCRAHA